MFEAVESVDIEVNYPEVRFKPRIAVLIEFECLWVEVEEIKEGRGPERALRSSDGFPGEGEGG